MVFPGDLEQDGFKAMCSAGSCITDLFQTVFYIVSHHGSINGQPSCMNPNLPIPEDLVYRIRKLVKPILMGRNGAYRGIYSPAVINFWKNVERGLAITENATHYLELNWKNENVTSG